MYSSCKQTFLLLFFVISVFGQLNYQTVTNSEGVVYFNQSQQPKDLLIIPSNPLGTIHFTIGYTTFSQWCTYYVYYGNQLLQTNPLTQISISPQPIPYIYIGPSVYLSTIAYNRNEQCYSSMYIRYKTDPICVGSTIEQNNGSVRFYSPASNCSISINSPSGRGFKISYSTNNNAGNSTPPNGYYSIYDGINGPQLSSVGGSTTSSSLYIRIQPGSNQIVYPVSYTYLDWDTVPCPGLGCPIIRTMGRTLPVTTDPNGYYIPFGNTLLMHFSYKATEISFIWNEIGGNASLTYPVSMYAEILLWMRDCKEMVYSGNQFKLTSFVPRVGTPTYSLSCS